MQLQKTAKLVVGKGKTRVEATASDIYLFIGFDENGLYKKEVYPAGEWFQNGAPAKEDPARGNQLGSVILDERFEFLRGLNPVRFDDYDLMFNSRSNYRGFIVNGIAIMESNLYGNAIYLYRADDPDWFEEITQTKFENLKKKDGSFIKRITHHPGWQKRLLQAVQ